jgi:exosortase/archaeosortase family protein
LRFVLTLLALHVAAYSLRSEILTATSALFSGVLQILGQAHTRQGHLVMGPDRGFLVVAECTAAFPAILLTAAVVALPGPPTRRLLGAAGGVLVLLLLNQLRLASLWYAAALWPAGFHGLHVLFWQPAVMATVVALWWWWLRSPLRHGLR